MDYTESKKILDKIRRSNEVMFRMAISHLMDVGIRHLTEENVDSTCAEIMKEDDSHSIMTNEFKCELVRMAAEIAKIDHIHLLVYISQNVFYDVGQNEIDYNRLRTIATNVIDWATAECADYDSLNYECGIEDEELIELGFGYIVPEENKGE